MNRFYVLIAAIIFLWNAACATETAAPTASGNVAVQHKVLVYYLFFTPRCETCLNMEAYAREAVETGFAEAVKLGTVEWHSYDTDQKEYKHFWDDFKLETKALIMVEEQNGKPVRWKNCEKIWDLANVKPDFITYVQDEVRGYLSIPGTEKPPADAK
jgi:hypothetical protein